MSPALSWHMPFSFWPPSWPEMLILLAGASPDSTVKLQPAGGSEKCHKPRNSKLIFITQPPGQGKWKMEMREKGRNRYKLTLLLTNQSLVNWVARIRSQCPSYNPHLSTLNPTDRIVFHSFMIEQSYDYFRDIQNLRTFSTGDY